MLKYIIRRALLMIPILFAVTFLVFTILEYTPGDPGRIMLGATAPQEEVDAWNQKLGVDKPFMERFISYVKGIVTEFDFGISYRTRQPVVEEIMKRFPYTLCVAFFSVLGAAMIGVPIGVMMAAKRNMLVDRTVNIIAMICAAIPSFVLALGLIYVFAIRLKWFPSYGAKSWKHFVLPLITIIVPSSVGYMRQTRVTMLETIRMEYITMARSKGIPENRVIFVHALKNAMIPIVTSILSGFAGMLGGTMILETVYGIPGLGLYILQGIQMKDVPITMASTIFLAAIFTFTMLLLDILYAVIDPRIKNRYVREGRYGR